MAALERTWVGFPAPTGRLTTTCNSRFTGSDTLFWLPKALRSCSILTYMKVFKYTFKGMILSLYLHSWKRNNVIN